MPILTANNVESANPSMPVRWCLTQEEGESASEME